MSSADKVRAVRSYLVQHDNSTARQIASGTGIEERAVRRILWRLVEDGTVNSVWVAGSRLWYLCSLSDGRLDVTRSN